MTTKSDTKNLTARMKELDKKMEWFGSDDFSLDEVAGKYKEAATLAKEIEHDLNELQNELELIHEDFTKE